MLRDEGPSLPPHVDPTKVPVLQCCTDSLLSINPAMIITASPALLSFPSAFFFKLGLYTLMLSNKTNHFSFVVCMASNGILII